ncbi:N,N-dimethylformamidase beta subunit family domain-containing protein, partial [Methylibium sp.]|uniref:N,N-dimethylformamidase beta subunit family domain-containing protein n=1 Tax=Methylibium sp. TaxID=2067992 RepID=UPI00185D09F3
YNATNRTATLTPSAALAVSSTYTATVRGGASDPRIKDPAGNALAANLTWTFTTAAAGGGGGGAGCTAPPNPVVAENCLAGNPASEWDVTGVGDPSIQGYATQISVNRGSTVSFKVDTSAAAYRFDIYRLGYYAGSGARKVATALPTATLPQVQPACLDAVATGLVDCGNWAISGSWAVPANAVSGIYLARVVRADTGGASHIVFIVRNDSSTSELVFKTADSTWQAYNDYGGNSLYVGAPVGRAYKVSYNRPFNTRGSSYQRAWLFGAEYPMVRWIEANGYDVSYVATPDVARSGSLLLNHKAFLSVGHDEYWSNAERASVEAARGAGVHLAFFSGNEMFWKTRWENSIDGAAVPYRTLVTYKETHDNAKIDPDPSWTGTWRDPRFSPPADGGRPENAVTGTIFKVNCCEGLNGAGIVVPSAEGKLRFWRNTSVASLGAGQSATLAAGTLGYEWDEDLDNGFRPPGLIRMSSTTLSGVLVAQNYGSTFTLGSATHRLTLYRHASGALVFGAGTIRWSWGLDVNHDADSATPNVADTPDVRMQQATVNLFADMGVQPRTMQLGLVAAAASTDVSAPVSTITSPAAGGSVPRGSVTTISGTASDSGGGLVGGVEVSVDGGSTWHPANGRANWSYNWIPSSAGSVTIRTRAADDSGNLETPSAGIAVTVLPTTQTCPCTIWSPLAEPAIASFAEALPVNLGVKFRAEQNGFIAGIRFYKGAANTGTHVGTLWSSDGTPLATATFTSETASGWQQVNFASPVAVTADTVYVASYFAPNGGFAADYSYFAASGVDNPPLQALQDGVSGGNGVFAYAAATAFPTLTSQSTNYWVDVVFTTTGGSASDITPPAVSAVTPASGATGVSTTSVITATFSENLDPTTVNASTFELRDAAGALVAAEVTYNATTRVATLTPSAALAASTNFTATVKGGSADPRVKDSAGNALAASRVWSFSTAAADTTAPSVTATSPANGASGVGAAANVTATFSEAMDASTIGTSTFELRDPANALVAATVSFNASTRLATLDPTTTLPAGTYTATLKGGSSNPTVKDAAGNPLPADVTWSFAVAAAGDTMPPTVTATVPSSGATGVSRTNNLQVTFSEGLDSATVNTSTFELRDPSNTLVPMAVTYSATNRRATLNPTPTLAPLTTYTVTVKGGATDPRVKDLAGNALVATLTWSFTTQPDTTPPTVSAVSPVNGAVFVSRTVNITATFSEAIDATTISTNTFELRDPANTLVPASVTYNATNRRATLNPAPTLAAGSTYTVIVKGGATDPRVKDVAGNALAANRTWSFSTSQ